MPPLQATTRQRWPPDRWPSGRGQAVVELAIVLPILLVLLVGISDWARLYTTTIDLEAGAREAAMYGGFSSSFWCDPSIPGSTCSLDNVPKTLQTMETRLCAAASHLPDYTGDVPNGTATITCTNPTLVLANSYTLGALTQLTPPETTQTDAVNAGVLVRPSGISDCAFPPANSVCQVHVALDYQFHMLLGGIGIPGVIQFPAVVDIHRDVTVAVNDFPQAP